MPELAPSEKAFLENLKAIIERNCSNEQFGVSELGQEIGMSRSNLLRKVKKMTGSSVAQFIRQIRLIESRKLLLDTEATVSEIAYQVGFSSPSYFIKCFREYYGYPPGEAKDRAPHHWHQPEHHLCKEDAKPLFKIVLAIALVIVSGLTVTLLIRHFHSVPSKQGKVIAVLPFNNESDDSSNVYLINGLMEAVLTKLQQINNLEVISRTSVEKYRGSKKSATEIARELGVDYLIEGSGQKDGYEVLLHIQLIDALKDNQLWAEDYRRQTDAIFDLQQEIAQNITSNIEVIITPDEATQIAKKPTQNLKAYDYFLKGMDQFYMGTEAGLRNAIPQFKQAIEEDPTFARAFADIAISYYLLDLGQTDKQYTDLINQYADKAMFYDDELAQSLLAKSFFYLQAGEYELAEPYLVKAYNYNPNSAVVINTLSEYYVSYKPNTAKYLEYALKGARIDIAANDSTSASYIFLHLSNAFIQNGFVEESLKYIDKSLSYWPGNLYSQYVKAYIEYAEDEDLNILKQKLIQTFQQDSSRLDIMQEIGKVCYFQRDHKESYHYYNWFVNIRQSLQLDIYRFENAKIARVFYEMGETARADELMEEYHQYIEEDHSIYRELSLSVYSLNTGNKTDALEHLEQFAKQDNFHYWVILFLDIDPLFDSLTNDKSFQNIVQKIKRRFEKQHDRLEKQLEAKDLIE
ncbi:helix-turn-helix domain-containing protein [Mangrovibacterium diazotrophicum]|uniref:TolB-like protein n=1 Tax=Mangrovibacterium diazotrophicum TaxID=1261403 RepID=A0A419W8V8_9BACT|nr:helix-turn-helix domain-containing protein [Mangrovibacterium diazotrophicum]RKD91876.1 TolB-like protein [Mangrovibacterium diazotrophicum]